MPIGNVECRMSNSHREAVFVPLQRLKVRTFIYRRLQGNQSSSGLQCYMAYWSALAVCNAAQLAATHCPKERILDPQSAATQTYLFLSQPHYGFHPAMLQLCYVL